MVEMITSSKQWKKLPDFQRIPAEKRRRLIKEYEVLLQHEASHIGKKFRKTKFIQQYCNSNGINWKTFYGYLRRYKKEGIEALVPKWGHRKGKSKYAESVLPFINDIAEPGKSYRYVHRHLASICKQKGISPPPYHAVRRIIIANGLSDLLARN